jgi:hypothetical protein
MKFKSTEFISVISKEVIIIKIVTLCNKKSQVMY